MFMAFLLLTGILVYKEVWNVSLGNQIASYFWIGFLLSILSVACGRILENVKYWK